MSAQGKTIVIVGGGYSGTLTAVNLLRSMAKPGLQVILIERDALLARGLAYRFGDDNLLLNVPAGNMSALADEADHFVEFCQDVDPSLNAKSFISRRLYGEYLEYTLAEAESSYPGVLQKLQGEVIALEQLTDVGGFELALADGRKIFADEVVLAFGHFAPEVPAVIAPEFHQDVLSPWDFARIDALDPESPVAILGMGHTAIDVLFRLSSCNSQRKVYLISRRGLLPHGHRFNPQAPQRSNFAETLLAGPASIRAYVRAIRQEVKRREALGDNWRDVINDLRQYTPDLWQALPEKEKSRFLSRVVAFWDIHRHRLAPGAARRLANLLQSGQVERISGKLATIHKNGATLEIAIRQRGSETIKNISASAIINCSGPNYDLNRVSLPVVRHLLAAGLLQQDPQKLGLLTDDDYQLIDARNSPVAGLRYIGPMLKAKYWEAIAVPELRNHARQLALRIIHG